MQQIIEGAPADVFASADTANMDKLTDAGLNGTEPVIFATNLLTIIVAPGNPLGITGVADLADPDLKTRDLRRGGAVRQLRQPDLRQRRRHRHARSASSRTCAASSPR